MEKIKITLWETKISKKFPNFFFEKCRKFARKKKKKKHYLVGTTKAQLFLQTYYLLFGGSR
jgi:hypothetical protein